MCVREQYTTGSLHAAGAYHLEASHLFGVCIGVCAIWEETRVVAMNYIVYVVLCKQLFQEIWCQLVWHPCPKRKSVTVMHILLHVARQNLTCCHLNTFTDANVLLTSVMIVVYQMTASYRRVASPHNCYLHEITVADL